MKAIVLHEYGGPEVLKFGEYPDPVPGALSFVEATSVPVVAVISQPRKLAGFRSVFFVADVTATRLGKLARLLDSRNLTAEVGTVLPFEEPQRAREMLAGAPHKRGKIVLTTHGVH
jgi:NADPH:quinone reductase-like Zn-dependent oxidoreductase